MSAPQIALEAVAHISHTNAAGVFGITPGGVAFYSYAEIPNSEHALIGVKLEGVRPYLEKPPKLTGLEGEIQRLHVKHGQREMVEFQRLPAPRAPRDDTPIERAVPARLPREVVEMQRVPARRPPREPVVASPWESLVLDASGRLVAPDARVRVPVRRVVAVPVDARGRAL